MFNHIKTSQENKIRVVELTRKLNLGPENTIARLAFSFSIAKNRKLKIEDLKDSRGKEYSKNVLFGNYIDFYISLLCTHYDIHKTNKDIPKLIKLHIDDGLELLDDELKDNPNIDSFDFLIERIESGLEELN
jgi:DNA sulfur modification protein DndE